MRLLGCLLILVPTLALGGDFESNGYSFWATVSHNGEMLQLSGRVTGGEPCPDLMIAVHATSDDGRVVRLVSRPIRFDGGGTSSLIEAEAIGLNLIKQWWEVTAAEAICGGRPRGQ